MSTVEHSTAWKAVAEARVHAATLCRADLGAMSLEDRTAMACELITVRDRLATALEQCEDRVARRARLAQVESERDAALAEVTRLREALQGGETSG